LYTSLDIFLYIILLSQPPIQSSTKSSLALVLTKESLDLMLDWVDLSANSIVHSVEKRRAGAVVVGG